MTASNNRKERIELACAVRWAARLGMHESVANHFSLAVSADGCRFLINPNGIHFSRVTASSLLLLDAGSPETMRQPDAPDPTAWALHSAIHRRNPQSRCVLHVHPKYSTVLACLADSTLPPLDQNCMRFFERVAVDAGFDGMGLGDEAERVARLVADKPILLLGNHGVMAIGPSVAEAFDDLYHFERACETYVTALMTNRPLRVVSPEVARKTRKQWIDDYAGFGQRHLASLMRILDDEDPGYAQ